MILSALLMMIAQATPTLAEVRALPPAAAGDLVLKGVDHATIVAVLPDPVPALTPPGTVEFDLIEQAVAGADGCTRKRWRARFRYGDGKSSGSATPEKLSAFPQIALAVGGACPAEGYSGLQQGTQIADGFAALRQLRLLLSPERRAAFECTDDTRSRLCDSDETVRRTLAGLSPWMVSRNGSFVDVRLGTRGGGVVTAVRFDATNPARIQVSRRIPAPA